MNASFTAVSSLIHNPGFAALWLDALIKSFVVLAFAGGLYLAWRRAAATTRHLIWFLAMASLPLLPLLSHVLPASHRPLWSVSGGLISGNQISLSLELAPAKAEGGMLAQPERAQSENPLSTPESDSAKRVLTAKIGQSWLTMLVIAWAAGMAFLLAYSLIGQFQLRKMSRNARRLDTPEWTRLLQESRKTLRLRRRVVLLQSAENVMPLTWGWFRPKVLMPLEAEQWRAERRRIVLLHELAHIKRWDCLTQFIARLSCALYWFNPLAWIAARRMSVERERACDDLVLNGGCKASDYAGHLVQIARTFRRAPQAAGIAMARRSNLEQRVTAIVDASRSRRLRPMGLAGVLIAIVAVIFCIGGYKTSLASDSNSSLRQQQIRQLEEFSKQKLKQSVVLMAASGDTMLPEYKRFFKAAITGDSQTITNMFASIQQRHPQYSRVKGVRDDSRLRTSYWQPILELSLAYGNIANCDPKYTQIAVNDMINSIPPGSIYFGGTDPGRGLPTAFSKSSIDADPFYVLTQNALADPTYIEYLRKTYGDQRQTLETLGVARRQDPEISALGKEYQAALDKQYALNDRPGNDPERKAADTAVDDLEKKMDSRRDEILAQIKSGAIPPVQDHVLGPAPQPIYLPTSEEVKKCFDDYVADAKIRLLHDKQFPNEPKQLKSGEEISVDKEPGQAADVSITADTDNGRIHVSGQTSVMAINGLIAKVIFDKNPDREFYIEESFPLDWMYPHLEPNGPIMKINRQPLATIPGDIVQKDREYWTNRIAGMVGDWLDDNTPVQTVAAFAEEAFVKQDYSAYGADPQFVGNAYAHRLFSKLRSSIAGVYAWRAQHATDTGEKQRMDDAADFAYRQALALCPYSPEAVYRYVDFLKAQGRNADARLIADTATRAAAVWDKNNSSLRQLTRHLSALRAPSRTSDSAKPVVKKAQQLETERAAREQEYAEIQGTLEKLKTLNHDELEEALPKAVTDRELNNLLAERNRAEQNLTRVKQESGPQEPEYQSAEKSVRDLRHRIDDRMEGILVGMQVKLDADSAFITAVNK